MAISQVLMILNIIAGKMNHYSDIVQLQNLHCHGGRRHCTKEIQRPCNLTCHPITQILSCHSLRIGGDLGKDKSKLETRVEYVIKNISSAFFTVARVYQRFIHLQAQNPVRDCVKFQNLKVF
jgi:hypothetical protein